MTPTCRPIGSHRATPHRPPPITLRAITMDSCLSLSASLRKWWRAPSKRAVGSERMAMGILCSLPRNLLFYRILQPEEHRGWVSRFRTIILLLSLLNLKRRALRDWVTVPGRKGSETLESFRANFSRIGRLTRRAHRWLKRRRSRK